MAGPPLGAAGWWRRRRRLLVALVGCWAAWRALGWLASLASSLAQTAVLLVSTAAAWLYDGVLGPPQGQSSIYTLILQGFASSAGYLSLERECALNGMRFKRGLKISWSRKSWRQLKQQHMEFLAINDVDAAHSVAQQIRELRTGTSATVGWIGPVIWVASAAKVICESGLFEAVFFVLGGGSGHALTLMIQYGIDVRFRNGHARHIMFNRSQQCTASCLAIVLAIYLHLMPTMLAILALSGLYISNVRSRDDEVTLAHNEISVLAQQLETAKNQEEKVQNAYSEVLKSNVLLEKKQLQDTRAPQSDLCRKCFRQLNKRTRRGCGCVGPCSGHAITTESGLQKDMALKSLYCWEHRNVVATEAHASTLVQILGCSTDEKEMIEELLNEDRCITCGKKLGGITTYRGCGCRAGCHQKHSSVHKTQVLSKYCWQHRHEYAMKAGAGWAERTELHSQLTYAQLANASKDAELEKIRERETFEQIRANKFAKLQTFYHGTSLAAAMSIKTYGFDVGKSGTNAGAMLGAGIYVTTTLEKALNYARTKPHGGVVLVLKCVLGKCKVLRRKDPMMKKWQEAGYDSAFSAAGLNGMREEHCIRNPDYIHIHGYVLGHTREARKSGYFINAENELERNEDDVLSAASDGCMLM